MTACQVLVETKELVQTWLMITNVIVWQDSMGKIVKTVSNIRTYLSCLWKCQKLRFFQNVPYVFAKIGK